MLSKRNAIITSALILLKNRLQTGALSPEVRKEVNDAFVGSGVDFTDLTNCEVHEIFQDFAEVPFLEEGRFQGLECKLKVSKWFRESTSEWVIEAEYEIPGRVSGSYRAAHKEFAEALSMFNQCFMAELLIWAGSGELQPESV